MKPIASFTINHDTLEPGMYISRTDGDAVTYDLRFVRPNTPPFLENSAIHTIEHLFATYVRNSPYAGNILYFGPMGCRTGFYFLVRDTLSHSDAITLVYDAIRFIAGYSGDIPGVSSRECGNWREHNLSAAKNCAQSFVQVMDGWSCEMLKYTPE